MLDIFSLQHAVLLAAIALIVVGPADLPRLMRMAGRGVAKGRSLLSGLNRTIEDWSRTSELDGLRAELNALKRRHPLSSLEAGMAPSPIKHRPFRG